MDAPLNGRSRPAWLWPVAGALLWLLAAGVSVVLYDLARPRFFVPEIKAYLAPFAKPHILVPCLLVMAVLTVIAYTATFWKPRTRRPKVGLVALMLAWSVVLAGYFHGASNGNVDSPREWLLMAAFVIVPPAVVLFLESLVAKALLRRGMKLYDRSEYLPAVRLLRLVRLLLPGDRDLTRRIGHALFHAREWESAEAWLRLSRSLFPDDAQLAMPLAELAIRREDWREAATLLREHLDRNVRDQDALEKLARAHLELGETKQAIWALEQLDRSDTKHLLRIAELCLRVKDCDKALAIAVRIRETERKPHSNFVVLTQRVLENQPDHLAAMREMTRHHEALEQPEEVNAWRERVLRATPEDDGLRRTVMNHLREAGKLLDLERHLHALLNRPEPKHDDFVELVELLSQRRAWEELEKWIGRAKEHAPDSWEFLLAEAELAIVQREFDQSFRLCHMARARARTQDQLKRIDAVLQRLERSRSQNEVQELREAIEGSEEPIALRWELVERLVVIRAHEQLVTEMDEIIRQHPEERSRVAERLDALLREMPDSFTLLNYLRDLKMREGDHDAAFETSERMANQALDPDKVMAEACESTLRSSPGHARSLAWLAELAHRSGDHERAVEMARRWFAAEPRAREVPENLQRLFESLCALSDLDGGIEAARGLLDLHHREVENLKSLASLYQIHGQLREAQRCHLRARDIDDQDREVRASIEALDREIRLERIEEIQAQLDRGEDSPRLHHEMGDLLYSFERYAEAVPHLQRAAVDSNIRNLCQAKIAHALAHRGMLDLAHEHLSEVTLESDDPEQMETLKAIHYNVGEIFREENQPERALEIFKRLYRADAGYRNVLEKLERLTT